MREIEVTFFRALADATRQDILEMLKEHEQNVNEICRHFEKMTQPTVSHHLQILKRCGLVKSERRGKMIYYTINRKLLRDGFETYVARFNIQILE